MGSSEKQKYWSQQYKNKVRAIKADQFRLAFLAQYPRWEEVKNQLSLKRQQVIECRHILVKDKIPSFADIGKSLGMSRQAANSLYKDAMAELKQLSNS